MGDVSTRPGGIVEAAAREDLVGRLRCVQDDDILPTESERVYLAILASPFEELEFSVKTHLVGENKDIYLWMWSQCGQLEKVAKYWHTPWSWRQRPTPWLTRSMHNQGDDGE